MMRSGHDDYSGFWGNAFYDNEFKSVSDLNFTQKVFAPRQALVSKRPVSSDYHRGSDARVYEDGKVEIPYAGQPFDPNLFELVKTGWTHEHCLTCMFSIEEGHTYWLNRQGQMLCDACYEHYVLGKGQSK